MNRHLERALWLLIVATTIVGCTSLKSAEAEAEAVATRTLDADTTTATPTCRAYEFRGWSLSRDDATITLTGEAYLPTPAWTVELHETPTSDAESIHLAMETVPPPGLSNTVLSWVGFETQLTLDGPDVPALTVSCEQDIVWQSSRQ